jgi:molybdopterin-containing oxidoreductase family membrane subunit
LVAAGLAAWWIQLSRGLGITGLSRDVSWGLYVSQFTFFVGVAASAVMVVVPYYLHDFKAFGRLLVLGETLAIAALVVAGLFIVVDLGQPSRVLNVLLYPSPQSLMFWDMLSLGGYLAINLVLVLTAFWTEKQGLASRRWVRPLAYLSIPWAVSIHTVTAFLYAGLPGRPFWETAVLAPRFLASAFCSGPSLLLLIVLLLKDKPGMDVGPDAVRVLTHIIRYALAINLFLVGVEVFTALYSQLPGEVEAWRMAYLDPQGGVRWWMWGSAALSVIAFGALFVPAVRVERRYLALAATLVFAGVWMEKGLGFIVGGFEPSPLGYVTRYSPTFLEATITLGVWGTGALVLLAGIWLASTARAAEAA